MLPLPNIGNTPRGFEVAFGATPDAERAQNAKSVLEAFWPASRVLSATSPRDGAVRLRYSSPTKTLKSANQTLTTQLCSSEGGVLSDDEFLLAEVFQQDNEDQARVEVRFLPCSVGMATALCACARGRFSRPRGYFDVAESRSRFTTTAIGM